MGGEAMSTPIDSSKVRVHFEEGTPLPWWTRFRIVCSRCVARCEVIDGERIEARRTAILYVRCHGEHRWVEVAYPSYGDEWPSFSWDRIDDATDDDVHQLYVEAECEMQRYAKRAGHAKCVLATRAPVKRTLRNVSTEGKPLIVASGVEIIYGNDDALDTDRKRVEHAQRLVRKMRGE